MDTLPALTGYAATVTPLRGNSTRVDVAVTEADQTPAPFTDTDIIAHLRLFFDKLEAEASERKGDPVAMTNGLMRLEALLADVRYVRDTVRDHTSAALSASHIRKLTVEHVGTVEGTSASERDWDHGAALTRVLHSFLGSHTQWVHSDTGELLDVNLLADEVLAAASISYWRMGALKERGINPNDVSSIDVDENGKPVRTPAVRIHDNRIRRSTT